MECDRLCPLFRQEALSISTDSKDSNETVAEEPAQEFFDEEPRNEEPLPFPEFEIFLERKEKFPKELREIFGLTDEEYEEKVAGCKEKHEESPQQFTKKAGERKVVYCLLNPIILAYLPLCKTKLQRLLVFVCAILYIGQGSITRPYDHCKDATQDTRGEKKTIHKYVVRT